MKRAYKALLMLIATLIVLSGCMSELLLPSNDTEGGSTNDTEVGSTDDPEAEALAEAYKADPDLYVCFHSSTGRRENYVSVDDVMSYESRYPDCGGTLFRDQLTGEDLCIYNSYLYAMENRFIGFELYVEDDDKDFSFIRDAVSMDSALLEQNTDLYGERIFSYAVDHVGQSVYFSTENFTENRWELKMQALEKCRQIVADIPAEYTTDLQRMEYLYSYVCDNVEYIDYGDEAIRDYLYDAVCMGRSNCDGYSNMLSLLFNLMGVECCEAAGSNAEDSYNPTAVELLDFGGHTWVVAKVDGEYYNFDPTFEDTGDELIEGELFYFGFSDELAAVRSYYCEALRPKCTDTSRDFPFAHLVVDNIEDQGNIAKIADLTDSRTVEGMYLTVVAVKDDVSEEEYNSFFDKYIDTVKEISYASTRIAFLDGYVVIQFTTEPW